MTNKLSLCNNLARLAKAYFVDLSRKEISEQVNMGLRSGFSFLTEFFYRVYKMDYTKNIVDLAIFSILGFMGFIALWFTVERMIFLRRFNASAYSDRTEMETSLTNNMTALFIIYSNAPYVGLLGTVVGIMLTFYEMGMSGGLNASDIMVGMSLALNATALGLVVAIPTLIAYNALTRKISVISNSWKEPVAGSRA